MLAKSLPLVGLDAVGAVGPVDTVGVMPEVGVVFKALVSAPIAGIVMFYRLFPMLMAAW
jgi:hypothetical protein